MSTVNLKHHYQFVIFTLLYSLVSTIKVDFGTRGGPIIPPPPSTPSPPPSQPYRDPAPVWEDQSNDIPNPRPYVYHSPPPSRSRENTVNIFDPNYKPAQYTPSSNNNPHVTPVNNFNNQYGYSLVPIYIPNEGYRYFVVVPVDKWNYLNTNLIHDDHNSLESQQQQKYDKYDKYNGKYNAKLKKYKAYEKFLKPTTTQHHQQQYQQQNYQQYHQEKDRPIKKVEQWNKQ
ncbi:hypothetical protein ACKWTF_004157 [Chironomus riparius]